MSGAPSIWWRAGDGDEERSKPFRRTEETFSEETEQTFPKKTLTAAAHKRTSRTVLNARKRCREVHCTRAGERLTREAL